MKLKPLPSQEYLKECFNYDPETGKLYWKERPKQHFRNEKGWKIFNSLYSNKEAFTSLEGKLGYHAGRLNGIGYKAHRIIWKLWHGTEPEEILHSDGNKADNRIEKLRGGTKADNQKDAKKRSDNTSNITGISWYERYSKWLVRIYVNEKSIHIGYFDDFFEACCKRKSAEVKYGFHENHGRR